MSQPTPPRRPHGARQRTNDRERRPSEQNSESERSYSYIEDGFISSEASTQGASLSRSAGRRRGMAPPRSNTTGSALSGVESVSQPTYASSQEQWVTSPSLEVPAAYRPEANIVAPVPRHQRSLGPDFAPHLYSSPAQSMASLRRETESDHAQSQPVGNSLGSSRNPSSGNQASYSSIPSSLRQDATSRQGSQASNAFSIDVPDSRSASRQQSLASEPEATGESVERSQSQKRWATIRRAVHQTPPPPPVPALPPSVSSTPGLRLTPAASSTAGSTVYGSASGFSIPRTGSAMSSLTDAGGAGLAPPPSMISGSTSSSPGPGPSSRSARAVMNFRNAVDQARSGVTGMGSGLGSSGLSTLNVLSGGLGRVGMEYTSSAPARPPPKVLDDESTFAREVMGACVVARFGPNGDARGFAAGAIYSLGTAAAAGFRRPVRKGTVDGMAGGSTYASSTIGSSSLHGDVAPPESRGSLKTLHHVLVNQASLLSSRGRYGSTSPYFPHQTTVLSTILSPFLSINIQSTRRTEGAPASAPGPDSKELENEQWLAIEVYEMMTKSWPEVKRPQNELDRWLWCCHAAAQEGISVAVRARLLLILDRVFSSARPALSSTEEANAVNVASPSPLQNPKSLQILAQALFLIYPWTYGRGNEMALDSLNSLTATLKMSNKFSAVGQLDLEEVEREYGVRAASGVTGEEFRITLITEAAIRLLSTTSDSRGRWFLLHFIENQWPIPGNNPPKMGPLKMQATRRKILTFLTLGLSLIRLTMSATDATHSARVGAKILQLIDTRILRELDLLHDDLAEEPRSVLIFIFLLLLGVGDDNVLLKARNVFLGWFEQAGGWKEAVESEIKRLVNNEPDETVIRVIGGLRNQWPGQSGAFITPLLITTLFERLTVKGVSESSTQYEEILHSLASDFPQRFYGPLFACARSTNRTAVSKELRTLTAVSRAYPDFWIANAEMMCIALVSEPGAASTQGKGKQRAGEPPKWGKARLGQAVIFLELIALLRQLSKNRKEDTSTTSAITEATNFFVALETRVAVLLEAKELLTLSPMSVRLLVATLLMEIRLFTRSLKPASWLPKMVEWACTSHVGAMIKAAPDPFTDQNIPRAWTPVTDEVMLEVDGTMDALRALYSSSWLENMSTPKMNVLSLPTDSRKSGLIVKSSELEQNLTVLATLPTSPLAVFQLLVAVSGLLLPEHHSGIGAVLWAHHLDGADPRSLGPISFLIMQSAEKSLSKSLIGVVSADLTGQSEFLKNRATERLIKLFSWRYQIATQPLITDRAHRRPFKSGRPPLSFVPTDIGSQYFISDRVEEVETIQFASTLPPEIRRRLIDLGWDKDTTKEEKRSIQDAAPLSAMPSDRLAMTETKLVLASSTDNEQKGLLRRKSSGGGAHSSKRKPVFVAGFAALLDVILQLTSSQNLDAATIARMFISEIIREDPGLLSRPLLERLSDYQDVGGAVNSFERSLRLQKTLPPAFSHLVFNHLAGLLKTLTRDTTAMHAPIIYAYTLPALSMAASSLSGISIRELKKAKLDGMLLPSGSLWFSDQMLPVPMFPRSFPRSMESAGVLPPSLVAITMVRTSQNDLLTTLLKRNPREVHIMRKTFSNLVLPSLKHSNDSATRKELSDFLPNETPDTVIPKMSEDHRLHLISLALSRSHLLLVAQVFRCLNRQTTDYQEISLLLDGINRILLRQGDDLGIVCHSMIDYMIAMTRFRRLFSSNGGFMLIMPAIWKVYCDAELGNKSIRGAMEYTIGRFHTIHPEAFVFQSVDVAAAMISHSEMKDKSKFAANVTNLFISLGPAVRGEVNAGGIQNLTKMYEREAIITSLNDTPTATASNPQSGDSMSAMVDQLEGKPFPLENLARLCLTVIADDPFIIRAEQFLVLFRYLTPSLYNNSMTARNVLGNGIDALGTAVFSKAGAPRPEVRPKVEVAPTMSRLVSETTASAGVSSIFTRADAAGNFKTMKQEYLHLIVAFTKAGGQLSTEVIRKALELLKAVLRDSPTSTVHRVALFLQEFTESTLLRDSRPTPKQTVSLLSDIVPLIYSHGYAIDFSGVFEVLGRLCKERRFMDDPAFNKLLVDEFCGASIDTLEAAAAANTLRAVAFTESFSSFIVTIVQASNVDPLISLRGRPASAGLLGALILPICLKLPLSGTLRTGEVNLRRIWVRLLGIALSGLEGVQDRGSQKPAAGTTNTLERHNSVSQGVQNSPRGLVSGLLLAVQVIKIIMVRAGDDIALMVPDVWQRIAFALQAALADGSGGFSLVSGDQNDALLSPLPSPIPSRPSSPTTPTGYFGDRSMASPKPERAPRAVDYAMWSILEMMCFYRTPLNLHLRQWLQEKLLQLEAKMEATGTTPNRKSFRDTRRLSFSPFTKTRHRSGVPSTPGSPSGSPSFRPQTGMSGVPPPFRLGSPQTMSTFDRFPQASPLTDINAPRIRHLGPEYLQQTKSQKQAKDGASAGSHPVRAAAKLISISRPALVQESHRRVDAVRVFWGYESFTGPGEDMSRFEAWTSTVALRKIVEETSELTKEFHDVVRLEKDLEDEIPDT